MMIHRIENEKRTVIPLKYSEMVQAHELCARAEFEQDFLERYRERCEENTGLCNLPEEGLADETHILYKAYQYYEDMLDCNTAYNVTMDLVIDAVEHQMQLGNLTLLKEDKPPRVAIIIDDGIISAVYASAPDIQVEITEIDKNYASSDMRDSVYEEHAKDSGIQPLKQYSLLVPGYEQNMEVGE